MPSFKDAAGREWKLALNGAVMARVKREAKVDLFRILDKKAQGLDDLLSDGEKLVAVAYAVCLPRAEELHVTPEDFGSAIDGPAFEALGEAMLESIADFFRRSKPALMKLLAKLKELGLEAERLALVEIDSLTLQMLLAGNDSSSPSPAK